VKKRSSFEREKPAFFVGITRMEDRAASIFHTTVLFQRQFNSVANQAKHVEIISQHVERQLQDSVWLCADYLPPCWSSSHVRHHSISQVIKNDA
jgi:hypothetical protein